MYLCVPRSTPIRTVKRMGQTYIRREITLLCCPGDVGTGSGSFTRMASQELVPIGARPPQGKGLEDNKHCPCIRNRMKTCHVPQRGDIDGKEGPSSDQAPVSFCERDRYKGD